jgi:hypothetical protein
MRVVNGRQRLLLLPRTSRENVGEGEMPMLKSLRTLMTAAAVAAALAATAAPALADP